MSKEYNVNIKVFQAGTPGGKWLKYRGVKSLLDLTRYLDREFPSWLFVNCFDRKTKRQVGSFTRNNRPTSAKPF
jgi:hypothetical protein